MTMRDTLTKMAEHHIARGKGYGRLAKCFGAMSKAAKADMGGEDSDREADVDTNEVSDGTGNPGGQAGHDFANGVWRAAKHATQAS